MLKRNITVVAIGAITIVLSCILFIALVEAPQAVDIVGFVFILFAQAVLFGGIVLFERVSPKNAMAFMLAGTYTVLFLYSLFSILLSLGFILFSQTNKVRPLVVIQMVLLAAAGVLLLLLNAAGKALSRHEAAEVSAHNSQLLGKATAIRDNPDFVEYFVPLGKVIDAIRYADTSSHSQQDDEIWALINQLEDTLEHQEGIGAEEIFKACDKIVWTIGQRNYGVKSKKSGGF